MKKPEKHRSRVVQDSVYYALRRSIINLNLAPGTSISEMEISQKFQVSRTPVREAFIHLSVEGLVKVIPQKETMISLIDLARVKQEFFLRESLEIALLEMFISNCNEKKITEMENLITIQSDTLKNKSYIDFMNYDDQFHQILYEVANQQLSWEVLSSMSGHYHRVRMLSILIAGIADEIIDEHKKILSALKEKDLIKSKKLLYLHMHNLDAEEKILLERFPDYFLPKEVKNTFDVDFGGIPDFRNWGSTE